MTTTPAAISAEARAEHAVRRALATGRTLDAIESDMIRMLTLGVDSADDADYCLDLLNAARRLRG